jgi:hypothetical protein
VTEQREVCVRVWLTTVGARVLSRLSSLHTQLTCEHACIVYIAHTVQQTDDTKTTYAQQQLNVVEKVYNTTVVTIN